MAIWDMPLIRSFWTWFGGQRIQEAQISSQSDDDGRTPGWYDPKLQGGRMLDVRIRLNKSTICFR
jgi:hypothetical protein